MKRSCITRAAIAMCCAFSPICLGPRRSEFSNLICITGDPPKMGNYPDATAVFDVDAIGLVNIVHNLNHGLDLGRNPIGAGTAFVIGVGANPGLAESSMRKFAALNIRCEAGRGICGHSAGI